MADAAETPLQGSAPTDTDDDARRYVRGVVRRARSSFFWPMLFLPKVRREGMFAIYAFCREIDDVADEPAPIEHKRAALVEWRDEIDRLYAGMARAPTARALAPVVGRYSLAKGDFLALIDGMEMDAEGPIIAPSLAELELYCARVAGAVGRLSVRVFGAAEAAAETVAEELGQALQLTNILRDVAEDAERDRLYLPREILERHGVPTLSAAAALAHPALAQVCGDVAAMAENRFEKALAALNQCARRPMRPAIAMLHVYRRMLARMKAHGFDDPARRISLSTPEKAVLVLRYSLF